MVRAEELPPDLPQPPEKSTVSRRRVVVPPGDVGEVEPKPTQSASVDLIAETVARQIRPLRRDIERYQHRTRVHDVLGGIGYIFGVMGLAAYFLARRERTGS